MFDFLAIDWGSKRTGLAFGSTITQLVLPYNKPLLTIEVYSVLEEHIKLKKIQFLVIGKPTNFQLQNTEVTTQINNFCEELKIRLPELKQYYVNENNTSKNNLKTKDPHTINHNAALEIARIYLSGIPI